MTALTLPFFDFEIPLDIVVLGALSGTTYALFGMGLALAYQASRAINFAQGAMGVLPHFLLASLVVESGWGYWPALIVALAVSVGSGALLDVAVIRRLSRAPRLVVLVATLGAGQLFMLPMLWMVDLSDTRLGTAKYPVPFEASFSIGTFRFESGHIMIMVVAPVLLAGLTVFLRKTTIGMASRAAAENRDAASLSGVPVHRISTIVFMLTGLLAGAAAILAGGTRPILTFTFGGAGTFTSSGNLLLLGLGAAMLGGLASLPQVFAAGVGLGVVEALLRWNNPAANGMVQLAVMALIVGSLLLRTDLRQTVRGGEESSWSLAGNVRALPQRLRVRREVRIGRAAMLSTLALASVALPLLVGSPQRVLLSAILIYVMVALSLVILTGWAGQVTLGHFAFVGLAAFVGARMDDLRYPMFGALFIAIGAVVVLAVVMGLPALRMKGSFLAVTTLAGAVMVQSWLLTQPWLAPEVTNPTTGGAFARIPRREIFGIDLQNELAFYYFILVLAVVAIAITHQLRRTGIARRFGAVRDNEPMAAALGIGPPSTKLLAFVVSGAMAAFAGFFYGSLVVSFSASTIASTQLSLSMVTMVILGGSTTITGAILGALYVRGLPYFIDSPTITLLTSGAGILVALLFLPGGLAGVAFRIRDRILARVIPYEGEDDVTTDANVGEVHLEPRPKPEAEPTELALDAENISVHYGGLVALDGASMHVTHGEIVGLIGPNGAGKTSFFDVLSGFTQPTSGTVRLLGRDITHLPVQARARMALGRSFQEPRLFEGLPIIDCFKVALERHEPAELIPSMLALPPATASERRKEKKALEIIELLSLQRFAERTAEELSTGTRRIAELGCMIAMGAEVLLLDEPTGGIAQSEVPSFCRVLREVRDHLDASIVVIGHDIPMMVDLCDRMYVLSSGRVIAEGDPSNLQANPHVIAAYFGTDTPDRELGSQTRTGHATLGASET